MGQFSFLFFLRWQFSIEELNGEQNWQYRFSQTEKRSRFLCSDVQLCLILWDPMNSSLLGSSVHGIFQARILEWVAISYSRGCSKPRDWTLVSCIAGEFFTAEPLGKSLLSWAQPGKGLCISCIGKRILYHCTPWEQHQGPQLKGNKVLHLLLSLRGRICLETNKRHPFM